MDATVSPLAPRLALPNLDIDVLRAFVAIAETGSFTKAAKAVFRTPSAVSMQIKKLEETIGRSVFDRDNRTTTLTPDGELLLGYARRMLDLNRETMARFLTPEVEGVVRIGATGDFAEYTLPDILRRFAEYCPHVSVDVMIESRDDMLAALAQNRLDMVFINSIGKRDFGDDARIVHEEELVWAGLAGGTAQARNPIPVAMWNEGCVWHKLAVRSLKPLGREHRVTFMSGTTSGQRAAMLADLAIAPFPKKLVRAPLVHLTKRDGLPEIGKFKVIVKLSEDAGPAAKLLVEEIALCCQ